MNYGGLLLEMALPPRQLIEKLTALGPEPPEIFFEYIP